ncbi:unnamed protein product [Schistocephalus solidus]|uniref:DUF5737 domain-containing protein n=1 Tax=Schistocephalus solidus TaxID=70667 RepID=A0A183SQ68_SCHSO|nr:unnamed protein product [Schistocephalus solidus]
MAHTPIRFEEIGYNFGFTQINPNSSKGYYVVYRLFMQRMEEGSLVLIRGNEDKIVLKDIEGPVEEREKVTIFCPDIKNFYKFNLNHKLVGFSIQANRRSKTGYWLLAFEREGQLQAFCDFLTWVVYGRLPRRRQAVRHTYSPISLVSAHGPNVAHLALASKRTILTTEVHAEDVQKT